MIKTGIGGAALLASIRFAYGSPDDGQQLGDGECKFLSEADRAIVAAIAPAMLEGALPPNADYLRETIFGVDRTISGLTPSIQSEVRELFDVLNFPPARMLMAGVWKPWSEADVSKISYFLESWQKSRIQLLRSGYDALHEIINAAWYANPKSWNAIGYSGPPDIGN